MRLPAAIDLNSAKVNALVLDIEYFDYVRTNYDNTDPVIENDVKEYAYNQKTASEALLAKEQAIREWLLAL